MKKEQIRTDKVREPMGHFSQAIAIEAKGKLVFISGMTSRRPDGSIAGIGDVEAQTKQVCENIKSAVEAAGGTTDDVVRVDVYVRNIEPPAYTMVEVTKMVSPDYVIEINAIAVVNP